MECYHLPWVHPGLVKVSPLEAHHRWQGAGMYSGMCTSPIAADTEDGGWQVLDPLPGLSDDDAVSARFVWLFPNVALNVMPNHLFVIHATPVTAAITEETTYLLTRPDIVDDRAAQAAIDGLAGAGVDFVDVTATLEREGVEAFQRSFQDALATLSKKVEAVK
jgi:choline monooxygenase